MENTVIGVYDSYTQAQNARNELISAGFFPDDVALDPHSEQAEQIERTELQPQGSAIGNFFRSLFGMEQHREHGSIYAEAVRRGSCVLAAHASSDEMRERATQIMNRYDPVDIEERSAQWRSQGWSAYDESAPRLSADEIEQERRAYGHAGAAQRLQPGEGASIPVVDEELRVGARDVQRGGVRVFHRARETPVQESVQLRNEQPDVPGVRRGTVGGDYADTIATTDDADFRAHWQNAYGRSGGRYEDYDAAYRYGSTMAGSGRFQNYRWTEVEPQLRGDWETSHPESTWDKVKDAVRYAAERVTGRH